MKVYDIRNTGPNHRFTVRGTDGQPLLVSNCCQAVSAIILKQHKAKLNKLYPVVMTTYDEMVSLVPENEEDLYLDAAIGIMSTTPDYLPGLPLGVECSTAIRYGDAK